MAKEVVEEIYRAGGMEALYCSIMRMPGNTVLLRGPIIAINE
jgi:hypothetical protein